MDRVMEMALVSGASAKIVLPEPGDFESFYVISMGFSGNTQFWGLLTRLMAAAGRPVCAINEALRRQGTHFGNLTPSAKRELLGLSGYGLGILFGIEPPLHDEDILDRRKLLLLRDPRDMVLAEYRYAISQTRVAPAPSFLDYLQSASLPSIANRYRRFAEFRRRGQNVTLVRYEDALAGWSGIAADLVTTLDLPIDPLAAAAIAGAAPRIGDQLSINNGLIDGAVAAGLSETETSELEAGFAGVLAAFGYPARGQNGGQSGASASESRKTETPPSEPPAQSFEQAPARARPPGHVPRPRGLTESDPVLHSRLKPNASAEMHVLGRRVIMDVDAAGCRPVVGQPNSGVKTLAAYGCSFTFGTAVVAEETFCSQLQGMRPSWRVENHGVPDYSTLRNLIQLEREIRWDRPEFVTFCWISRHHRRDVGDATYIQTLSKSLSPPVSGKGAKQRLPRAELDADGAVAIQSVSVPRHDLIGVDLTDFRFDQFYLDLVSFRLFERANALVTSHGGHFFITTLQGRFSAALARRLAECGVPVVDASLDGDEYLCLPDDPHPNALAHRIYAERINEYLGSLPAEPLEGH